MLFELTLWFCETLTVIAELWGGCCVLALLDSLHAQHALGEEPKTHQEKWGLTAKAAGIHEAVLLAFHRCHHISDRVLIG